VRRFWEEKPQHTPPKGDIRPRKAPFYRTKDHVDSPIMRVIGPSDATFYVFHGVATYCPPKALWPTIGHAPSSTIARRSAMVYRSIGPSRRPRHPTMAHLLAHVYVTMRRACHPQWTVPRTGTMLQWVVCGSGVSSTMPPVPVASMSTGRT
jgi:hypothetical protein